MDIEDIKKLPAEERIKKLKELEEQRKKEIESAEKLIKDSVAEISKKEEQKRDIPIEQVKAFDIDFLTTEAEREIFRAKRFVNAPKKQEHAEDGKESSEDSSLEETVSKEKIPQGMKIKNTEYKVPGREEPKNLYAIVKQAATEDTLNTIKGLEGKPYHEWNDEQKDAARAANYITDVGKGKIKEMYQANLSMRMLEQIDAVSQEVKRLRGEYIR